MHNYRSSPTLTNVSFSRNTADNQGGGMFNFFLASPTLVNVILWGDSAGTGDEIHNFGTGSTPEISYSLIEGCGGSGGGWDSGLGNDGGNNLDSDPLFTDAVAGNLRLGSGSPAIDAGDSTAANLPATDLDGYPRIRGETVDLGAYEAADVTGVEDPTVPPVPTATALLTAYPNPFSRATTIRYELAEGSPVRLEVFDLQGRRIRVLENAPHREPGLYERDWAGCDESGQRVPVGIYFYRLEAGPFTATRKLVLIR
jgi:hypothetical protein